MNIAPVTYTWKLIANQVSKIKRLVVYDKPTKKTITKLDNI